MLPLGLLALAAGAETANRDPSFKHRGPLQCYNVTRASTCAIEAHMPGDKTRELCKNLRLPEASPHSW